MIKIISLILMLLATPLIAQQTFNKLNVKELDVTSRVNVTSTTKASKPCPAMTETQRNAIVSPLSGSCIYNSTTLKLNVYNGSVWKAAGGGVDNWATASAYSVDDIVIESSKIYQCLIAHTSGTFATDLAALKWIEISAQGNLTGVITSTGLTTSISSQTGTGTKFVVDNTPTLITPVLGVASATSINGTTIPSSKTLETKDTLTTKGDIYAATAAAATDRLAVGANDQVLTADSTQATGLKWSSVGVTSQGLSEGSSVSTSTFRAPYNQLTTTATGVRNIETGNGNMLVNPDFEGLASPVPNGWTCTVGTCTKTTTSGEFSSNLAALKVVLSTQVMNVSQSVTTPTGIQKQGFARVIYRVPATMADFQICTLIDAAEQTCVPTANLIKDDTFRGIEIPLTFGATSAGIKFKTTSSYTANAYFDGAIIAQGLGLQNLQLDSAYSAKVSSAGVVSDENTNFINGNCTAASPSVCTFQSGVFSLAPSCISYASSSGAARGFNTTTTTSQANIQQYLVSSNATESLSVNYTIICQKSGNDYLAASANVYSQNANKTLSTTVFSAEVSVSSVVSNENKEFITSCTNANPAVCTLNAFTVTPNCTATTIDVTNRNLTITARSATSVSINQVEDTGSPTRSGFTLSCQKSGVDYETAFSPTIVGSFENVPTVPGAGKRIDIFSVSYGTTNATTACSASPCSYLDQIGDAVTSVTRSSAANYSINTTKTYLKLKCFVNAHVPGVGGATIDGPLSCASCSTLGVTTRNSTTAAGADTYGVISCQGTY